MRTTPLRVHAVDTAGRDGIQRNRVNPARVEEADAVMEDNATQHVKNCLRAGIRNFDLISLVHPLAVPTMRSAGEWLPRVREEAAGDLTVQALLMSPKKADLACELFESGDLEELAFVHSHDPFVLWHNSWIRRRKDGTPISEEQVTGEVDPDLAEEMREISQERYEAIVKALGVSKIPVNVYEMNATGGRDRETGEPDFVDPDVILGELERLQPANGGRYIICDTEAIADPGVMEKLMTAVRDKVGSAVGLHLHMLKDMPCEQVQAIVRAALRPLLDSPVEDCYIETGVANLGGCIAFDKANQNTPIGSAVQAVDQLVDERNAVWVPQRPDMQIVEESVVTNVREWDARLRHLSELPPANEPTVVPAAVAK